MPGLSGIMLVNNKLELINIETNYDGKYK
jgi:hypothetical protein